ncbi:MAG TPA: arsenate reductase ArsC [Rhizomicrobium sp.]|nr:arsenate reductase ArsC [Rhizomicrobium sp.]
MAEESGKPQSVLFVCTMNAVRSPMAAGLLRHLKGRDLYVESAGVHAGELDPMAIQVMAELGVTLADHHPRSFDEFRGQDFDLVVALSREAEQHAKGSAARVEYWPTSDPTQAEGSVEQRKAAYRAVRDGLKRQIAVKFA